MIQHFFDTLLTMPLNCLHIPVGALVTLRLFRVLAVGDPDFRFPSGPFPQSFMSRQIADFPSPPTSPTLRRLNGSRSQSITNLDDGILSSVGWFILYISRDQFWYHELLGMANMQASTDSKLPTITLASIEKGYSRSYARAQEQFFTDHTYLSNGGRAVGKFRVGHCFSFLLPRAAIFSFKLDILDSMYLKKSRFTGCSMRFCADRMLLLVETHPRASLVRLPLSK